eukprot:TRINITY_DN114745_c0_g1_i3.p1 TRINITY_DN114745_c0_g1~~TRINITY_DN114745_c0_g1_i3.p1  ORF type:complete len:130 (-),score=19.26 TRINITY_DN114745_c0_g1_i3:55-444(-)
MASKTVGTISFTLELPISSFILPVKLTQEQFAQQLAVEGSSLALLNTTVNHGSNPKKSLMFLANLLHVHLVNIKGSAAGLYGRTVQNQGIYVMAKVKGTQMTVEIKVADATLGSSLIAEVTNAFKTPLA